ncbi:unnamed protein product, partial [Strongylus vulgaris]
MIRSRFPKLEVPGLAFHEYFFKTTRKYADDVAMINNDTKEQFTFSDLKNKAKFVARALIAMGVEKGEVVILCLDNTPEAVYLFLAISLAGAVASILSPKLNAAGAVASILSPKLNADEMHFQFVESDTRVVFADPSALLEVQRLFRRINKPHRIICTGPRDLADLFPILDDLHFLANEVVTMPRIQPKADIVYMPFSSGIHGKRKAILTSHY